MTTPSPVTDRERLRQRERPPGWPVMRQVWRRLGFIHYRVDPTALARLLPPGLALDTWDGEAFVGLVPFTITGTRPPFLPSFHELNLRTYVHRGGQDPGVWFFSLDAASRLAVWGARATYKLPYFHASMAFDENDDGSVSYRSVRRAPAGGPHFTGRYGPLPGAPTAEVAPGTRDFFLLERYLLYSFDGTRLRQARVWHPPYAVSEGRLSALDETLVASPGITVERGRVPLVHYAHQVNVRIFRPSAVR